MALDAFFDFSKATVSTTYDASATSIDVSAGHGLRFPAVPFNAVWWDSTTYADPSDDPKREIVRVTNVATDTLTITRGQEVGMGGLAASTKNDGGKTYKLQATLTAKSLVTDLPASYAGLTGAAFTGAVTIASTATPGFALIGDGGSAIKYHRSYGTGNPVYRYGKARNTLAAPRRVQATDTLGNIQFWGAAAADDSTDATFDSAAAIIRVTARESFTSSPVSIGTRLEFATTAIGGTGTVDRVYIDSTELTLAANMDIVTTAGLSFRPGTGNGYLRMVTGNNPLEPGGGTEQHQTFIHNFSRIDSVSNYFNANYDFAVTDGTNVASVYSLLAEGNWTNAGGFTLARFGFHDYVADTNLLYHQTSTPGKMTFGEVTTGKGIGVIITGKDITSDADGETSGLLTTGDFILPNDANARTYYGLRSVFTLNTHVSGTNKTVHMDSLDTVNTGVSGTTVTLLRRAYGAAERMLLTSTGMLTVSDVNGNTYRPTRPHGKLTAAMSGYAMP